MTVEQIKQKAEEKYCKGCKWRMEQCLWAWRKVNGKNEPNIKNCSCKEVPAFIDGYHEGFKDCAKSRLNVTTISDCPIKDDWHYVKDGDLPKGEGAVLIYWKSGDIKCASVVEPYKVTEDTHIIAWKEIVLPRYRRNNSKK